MPNVKHTLRSLELAVARRSFGEVLQFADRLRFGALAMRSHALADVANGVVNQFALGNPTRAHELIADAVVIATAARAA